MTTRIIAAALASCALAVTPADAQLGLGRLGQSLLGRLKSQARGKAETKMEEIVQSGGRAVQSAGVSPRRDAAAPTTEVESQSRVAALPTTGPEPWPVNADARSVKRPTELRFAPELLARKAAFVEFSRYSCNDCEGGRGFDAWLRPVLGLTGYGEFERKVAGLTAGQPLHWRGHAADGELTVISETPVGSFACKQLHYQLTRRADHAVAERPGLLCLGRAEYASADSWIEVL